MKQRRPNAVWHSYLSMATRRLRNAPLFLVLGMGLFGSQAAGLCLHDPLDGAWQNINSTDNGRLEFNQSCNDVVLIPCDESGCHPPPPSTTVGVLRVLGACTPLPCDWDWTEVSPSSSGLWYVGTYEQVFAHRTVFVRYDAPGNFVEMVTRTVYRDERPDAEWRDYYRRAAVTVEPNVDRPGGDYWSFDLPAPEYRLCENACADDLRCQAYTYVPPGVQGPSARCWLKDQVPPDVLSWGMLSGWRR
jgi:hypothetical protein